MLTETKRTDLFCEYYAKWITVYLEAKTAKRKDADKYHNTRHLLKQYRKVAYAIQISEADMNVRMEMEHGTRLSTLEVNAELAGVDLSGSKLEGYARTVIRSKNMLQIIDNALNTVRMDEAVTNRKPEYSEIVSALETTVQTARQYFLHCDNAVVTHDDENAFLLEIRKNLLKPFKPDTSAMTV